MDNTIWHLRWGDHLGSVVFFSILNRFLHYGRNDDVVRDFLHFGLPLMALMTAESCSIIHLTFSII